METISLIALNIKCGGCVDNIKSGLLPIDGVVTVNVDIESGVINVTGNHLNKLGITTKLSDIGFPEK